MKKRILPILLLIIAVAVFAMGCMGSDKYDGSSFSKAKVNTDMSRILVYDVYVDLYVDEVGAVYDRISQAILSQNITVEKDDAHYNNDDETYFAELTIRVKRENLEQFLSLNIYPEMTHASQNGDSSLSYTDQTDAYYDDIERRETYLKNIADYEQMFSQATSDEGKVLIKKEIISLEEKLRELEKSIKNLEYDSEYSRLTIYIQRYTPTDITESIVLFVIFLGIPAIAVIIAIILAVIKKKKTAALNREIYNSYLKNNASPSDNATSSGNSTHQNQDNKN